MTLLAASFLAVPYGFADTSRTNPNDPKTPVTVSADALPTVQIDGVVWSQGEGPRSSAAATNPVLSSPAKGQIKVRWQANWDRDNSNLTYQVYRDGVVVNTQAQATTFWNRPTLEYVDTVASGSAHGYRAVVKDPFGKAKSSTTVSLTAK